MTPRMFGLEFPEGMNEFNILLWCWKHYPEALEMGAVDIPDRHELALQAIGMVFKPEEVTIDPWFRKYAQIWTDNNFATVWGCASAGKSNAFGLLALLWWGVDPTETMIFVCSTTREMLEIRIWESVLRHHTILKRKGFPGVLSRQRLAIVNEDDADTDFESGGTVKACIKGVAVQQGTAEQARSNLIGGHLPYVVMVVDEMQATREAAVQARFNLSKGAHDFRFFGLANPDSVFDLSGRHSEPLKGWNSVGPDTGEWETRFGRSYHFDGFKSPACTEPDGARKYPYLINREQIDRDIKENGGNEDSPFIWTFSRGWPPPQGASRSVLSETEIIRHGARDKVAGWREPPRFFAGIDPAFSATGDDAVLVVGSAGISADERVVVQFEAEIRLMILASDPRPVLEQLYQQVRDYGQDYGFGPADVCVDESGTQSFGDYLEMMWGPGILRVSFQGRASDKPVSAFNRRPAREVYANKVTEMWFNVAELVRCSQIRGLPAEAARQFTLRLVESRWPRRLEPKDRMKLRLKKSPNEADAAACCVEAAVRALGITPGATRLNPAGVAARRVDPRLQRAHNNLELSESKFLTPDLL